MAQKFDSILETVGNTPIVRINRLGPRHVNLYAKLECMNPMGSVKDRLALAAIEAAERDGSLQAGQTVVEATSGNTGIGLAMVCAVKGYPLVVVMSESFSVERRRLMRYLGAKVILTPAASKGSGMLAKAEELCEQHGWFLLRQFENPANADAHAETTAPEILRAFAADGLDYFVTGYGTGGTLNGVSRVFRQQSPNTCIVVCEPDNVPILASGIPQERDPCGAHKDSHPMFRPHLMQGWSPDFIPKLTEAVIDEQRFDRILPIAGDDALQACQALAQKEGLFVGISAGATLAGAIEVAESAEPGSNVLCMLPDTGERYLSTVMFDAINADMNSRELQISRSTPNYRFDAPPAAPSAGAEAPPQAGSKALEFVRQTTEHGEQAVVMFALEWCEFCWSVRKLMADYEIPYQSVDLDSVEYQKDNLGGEIRVALHQLTGAKTIPQIYVAGEYIGGATEFFDALKAGDMQTRLTAANVAWNQQIDRDPYTYLPSWLHAR